MMKKFAVVALAGLASAAMADVSVDLTGATSNDGLGGNNVVFTVNVGAPNVEITSIEWDLGYTPNSPSWTSEPNWDFQNSAFNWDMGDHGGVSDSNPVSLSGSEATSFFSDGNGDVRIELWEDFDDFSNAADGTYDRGSITLKVVPAPASLALLGFGGLVATRRRR